MKTGEVYKAAVSEADVNRSHWYVIVLYWKDNKNCLVVPAYSKDGAAVTDFLQNSKKQGFPENATAVLLDNSISIDFEKNQTAHEAWWVTAKHQWVRSNELNEHLGTMKENQVKTLIHSILAHNKHLVDIKHKPSRLASDVKAALESLIKEK